VIEAVGTCFSCTLRDHDSGQQCTVGSAAFEGLWEALERVLTGGDAPWRHFKSFKAQNARQVAKKRD
jgi:hypothetical protein